MKGIQVISILQYKHPNYRYKHNFRINIIFGYPFGLYLTYLKLEKVVLYGIPQRWTAPIDVSYNQS